MIHFNYPRILPFGENAEKRKTLRLYMYVTADALYSILKTGRLKLSHPWKTNDITECLAQGETQQRYGIKKYGYLCFSADCTSPAMWGYYAERGKGACLTFDFDVIEVQKDVYEVVIDGAVDVLNPIYIRKVKYSENRCVPNDSGDEFFIKSKEWEHEKEYRIVLPLESDTLEVEEVRGASRISVAYYFAGLMNYLSDIIMGPKYEGDEVEIKSFLKHCFPTSEKEYVFENGTKRIKYEVACMARYAGISQAVFNGGRFRLAVKQLLSCIFQDNDALEHWELACVQNFGCVNNVALNEALSRILNSTIECFFASISLELSTGDSERFYIQKIHGHYYFLRDAKTKLLLELNYPTECLANLYERAVQKFPRVQPV